MAIGMSTASGGGSVVEPGSRGAAVAAVQRLLGITADGIDGPKTTAAIKNFQRANGLAADGIVGPKTWAALQPATVAEGARGNLVTRIQRDLHVAQDGIDGPQTTSAIEKFQKAHHLAVDGVVGSHTWAALDALEAGNAPKAVAPTPKPAPPAPAPVAPPVTSPTPAPPAGSDSTFETNMRKLVTDSEGYSNSVYPDSDRPPNPTVGIGFNLNRGDARALLTAVGANYDAVRAGTENLTDAQVDALFSGDLKNAETAARGVVSNYDSLSDARKSVIVDMEFNLGSYGFSQFTGVIGAVEKGDFATAAADMKSSLWYGQTGVRSQRDVQMMETGNYPASF